MANYEEKNDYNAILGITTDNRVIVLEYTFKYSENFAGATRFEIETLTADEIADRNDPDNMREEIEYLWQEAVAQHKTTDSLDDFIEKVKDDLEAENLYFFGDDPSFRCEMDEAYDDLTEEQKKEFDKIMGVRGINFVDWNCGCCGRVGEDYKNWEWKVLFRPELIEEIAKYESMNNKEG